MVNSCEAFPVFHCSSASVYYTECKGKVTIGEVWECGYTIFMLYYRELFTLWLAVLHHMLSSPFHQMTHTTQNILLEKLGSLTGETTVLVQMTARKPVKTQG